MSIRLVLISIKAFFSILVDMQSEIRFWNQPKQHLDLVTFLSQVQPSRTPENTFTCTHRAYLENLNDAGSKKNENKKKLILDISARFAFDFGFGIFKVIFCLFAAVFGIQSTVVYVTVPLTF